MDNEEYFPSLSSNNTSTSNENIKETSSENKKDVAWGTPKNWANILSQKNVPPAQHNPQQPNNISKSNEEINIEDENIINDKTEDNITNENLDDIYSELGELSKEDIKRILNNPSKNLKIHFNTITKCKLISIEDNEKLVNESDSTGFIPKGTPPTSPSVPKQSYQIPSYQYEYGNPYEVPVYGYAPMHMGGYVMSPDIYYNQGYSMVWVPTPMGGPWYPPPS